jgi:hydroxypyruvate isomerase
MLLGKMEKGELGLAALPERVQDFRMQLELSIEYANCLNCKRYFMIICYLCRYSITSTKQPLCKTITSSQH